MCTLRMRAWYRVMANVYRGEQAAFLGFRFRLAASAFFRLTLSAFAGIHFRVATLAGFPRCFGRGPKSRLCLGVLRAGLL
jgi:hypothetical protein